MDLFAASAKKRHVGQPLAERMRPRSLDELVGQHHLVGPGRILSSLAPGRTIPSLILWGPPGSGKTTLARLLGETLKAELIALSVAVNTGLMLVLMRRRLPLRWAHVALVTLWWCPIGGTLISQYYNGQPQLALVVLVEIACIAAALDTWSAAISLAIAGALYAPMIIRDAGSDPAIYLTTLAAAAVFAIAVQILMRRSLVSGEVHRVTEARTAAQLARQLEELERSEQERQRLQDQLVHAQRMEAVGTLAAGVAHDMNNVLAAVTGYASLLLDQVSEPARTDLGQIITQAERGASLTRGLLASSRRGQ